MALLAPHMLTSAPVPGTATSGNVTVEVFDNVTAGKAGIYAGSIADANGVTGTQGNVTVAVKGGLTVRWQRLLRDRGGWWKHQHHHDC